MKCLALLPVVLCASICAAFEPPRPLITKPIDETQLTTLHGNLHPTARRENDRGPVPDTLVLAHVRLLLRRSAESEQAVEQLISQIHNPASPMYHHWLTPEAIGERFGAAAQDIDTVLAWLRAHGFRTGTVSPNRLAIEFSGTAAQVREAFHTTVHTYVARGETHWANAADPRLPSALAPVVAGIAKLNDFAPRGAHHTHPRPDATLSFSGNDYYLLAPYDFATIYNLQPLWNAGITGAGQTIALVEDSNINPDDVASFRAGLGLPALGADQLQLICVPETTCVTNSDETEGALDAEWAGAVAPGATILYVAADTVEDSASYVVNNSLAPVVDISYSQCESDLGVSGNLFWSSLWQTAVLQGITVVAAAGDFGGAVCDGDLSSTAGYATLGLSVNGIASTPNSLAVGGTDFSDTFAGTNGAYWSASSSSQTLQSALSYVPEMTWNNSCASNVLTGFLGFPQGETLCEVLPVFFGANPLNPLNIVAGSGGPSQNYVKPTWQANVTGILNDGVRDLPDVSLFASNLAWSHAYIYCMSDPSENGSPCDYTDAGDTVFNSGGGTSFAAAAFAGVMALVGQQTAAAQGNANYVLYTLAGDEYGTTAPNTQALSACNAGQGNQVSSTCLFYDVTLGDTTVPCQTGSPNCYTTTSGDPQGVLSTSGASLAAAYQAATGWDLATGLGSVNIANLVQGWTTSAADYTISGLINQSSGSLAGVTIALTGGRTGSATTNSSGKFTFVVPAGRTYVVTPSLNGYSFYPPSQNFKNLGGNRTANFTGTGLLPLASPSTSALNFESQSAGVPSAKQSVVLTNAGNGPLTLTSLAIGGTNGPDFTQTNTCGALPAQVAVGSTCTVSVVFTPSLAGPEAATLTFTDNSNGASGSTQNVALSGTGIVSIAISPASVSFGYAGVGVAGAPHNVQISNTSAVSVSIANVAVSGTDKDDFKPTSGCGASLAAGAKCTVSVVFDPAAAGSRSATLTISDTATGSPQSVALSGNGTEKPVAVLSPASLTFTSTSVGSSSAPKVVTLTNAGHGSLGIVGISASEQFAQTNNCTQALGSGLSCTISVTFKPSQTGTVDGSLLVTTDGIIDSGQVKLTGTGK